MKINCEGKIIIIFIIELTVSLIQSTIV